MLVAMTRCHMGIGLDSFPFRRPKDTCELVELCHSLGAGGVEGPLASLEPDYIRKLRETVARHGMYFEAWATLPAKDDTSAFERTVTAAKEAGATCLRGFCLGGRRYEVFNGLDEWKRFLAQSRASLRRAVPILEKHRLTLGLENHKDWTAEELLGVMREYNSEYLGVCLDTGNNIALLDDTRELVETLAPFTTNTHLKDMAVAEYPDGFLLVEMPFGEGMLDVPWIVKTVARARPATRFTLEMFTRSPLKIPCLTEKFWVTFTGRGPHLARTLRAVRLNPPRGPLPRIEGLSTEARAQLEIDNIKKCLAFARERLGLGA